MVESSGKQKVLEDHFSLFNCHVLKFVESCYGVPPTVLPHWNLYLNSWQFPLVFCCKCYKSRCGFKSTWQNVQITVSRIIFSKNKPRRLCYLTNTLEMMYERREAWENTHRFKSMIKFPLSCLVFLSPLKLDLYFKSSELAFARAWKTAS